MKALYKTVFALLGLAILLIVAIAIYTALNLGNLVKKGINDYSEPMLGIAVTVEDVQVNVMAGEMSLKNFRIANPPGYTDVDSIVVGGLNVGLDVKSLTQEVIVIDDIKVEGISLNAEQKGTSINLLTLKNTLQKSASKSEGVSATSSQSRSTPTASNSKAAAPKIAIGRFYLSDSEASLKTEFAKEQQVVVPGFELANIGTPENGVSIESATNEVLEPLLAAVIKRVQEEALRKGVEEKLEKEIDRGLKKALGDEDAVNAVKGLLKGL